MSHLADFPNAVNEMPQVSKIGDKSVMTYDYKCTEQRRAFVTVNPTTAVAANILNGSQVDFRFENQADRIAQNMYLRIDYANTGIVNAVVATPESFISQIQIFSDNGSTLLYQTISNIETYLLNNIVLTRNEHENTAVYRGTNANYSIGVSSFAPGVTGTWLLPIAPGFWKSTHFRPYSIYGNLLIRIFFSPGSQNIVSGALTTTNVVLRVNQYYEPALQKNLILRDAMLPKNFFYFAPQRHIETVNLTANVPYTLRLTGLKGSANMLLFTIQQQAFVTDPNNQFNFQDVISYEILDSANVSLSGYEPVTQAEHQVAYAHQIDNRFAQFRGFQCHSFSQAPIGDLARGTLNGLVKFDGFHSLRVTIPSTGTYTITAVAPCSETLKIVEGRVSTTRS